VTTATTSINEQKPGRPRRARRKTSLFARGEPYVWLVGGALVLCLLMVVGLLVLVFAQGFATFWPTGIVQIETPEGRLIVGEITRSDVYEPGEDAIEALPEKTRKRARAHLEANDGKSRRRLVRTGNFELTGEHFEWVDDFMVVEETYPEWYVILERQTRGRFYGVPIEFRLDGEAVATNPEAVWAKFEEHHGPVLDLWHEKRDIESEEEIGEAGTERAREIATEMARYELVLSTSDGQQSVEPISEIVRAYPANRLGFFDKVGVYFSRWGEFLTAEPREANSEGGVFQAIVGTLTMTLLMTFFVVPFGVLAALYLREYAKQGKIVSTVRIAINNLAGVPSIVYGIFGLGFFCYIVGGGIDQVFFADKLPGSPTYGKSGMLWASLTLALLTLPVVIVATEEALAAVPGSLREGSYACGASKWQTTRRIVLPRAMPGIMTGMVLAMARGAGEVAPLMLVGAVKQAPALPIDGTFPFLHPERSFLHLGFHIFDQGFQAQNSEAARPMVFTTTLLLITIVVLLNLTAIWVRARLRRKFTSDKF
jgi:phosphate transport system permease protein